MKGNYADATFYAVQGPADDAMDWIGRTFVVEAPFPINEAQIAYFAAMVEDPNENYWNAEAAGRRHGGIISPGGMLLTWLMPTPWHPNGPPEHGPVAALMVPLPGTTLINVSTETFFHAPLRVGDRLTSAECIEAISPLKRSAVGEGYFVTTRGVARNQGGTDLATNINVIYRYETALAGKDNAPQRTERAETEPALEQLPEATMPITLTRLVLNAAAARDFFPGHHDGDYARAQGVQDAYLNTMFLQGFVDRVGYAWAGYDAWLTYRKLRMVAPACNGETLRAAGRVIDRREDNGRRIADLEIEVLTERGLVVTSRLSFDLDGWSGATPGQHA
jgi:acyl dehydratase